MKTISSNPSLRFLILVFAIFPSYLGTANKSGYCSDYIRIWGIVKYYYPFKANPTPNLDSVFQLSIQNILRNGNKIVFNKEISELLEYSKNFSSISNPVYENSTNIFRIDSINMWIFDSNLISHNNRKSLIELLHIKREMGNPFVRSDPENGSSVFINEKRFITAFPPVELRLLALSRYWNAIYYFFPHKNLIAVDWNSALFQKIDEVIECKNDKEFHLIISSLASMIEDGHGQVHSYTLDKYYGYYQLPCEASYINDTLFITKILKTAINNPFNFGDKIIEIDNQSFNEYFKNDSANIWGSNSKRKNNICATHFLRSIEGKSRIIKLIRNDSIINVTSKSVEIPTIGAQDLIDYTPKQSQIIGEDFIYLNLSILDSIDFVKAVLSYKKPKIIIDLRVYPNWMLNQIADLFTTNDLPYAAFQIPIISLPGLFGPPELLYLKPRKDAIKVDYEQIVIMVNYTTISRGEFLCMAFQSLPNVLTFGDKTAGADGDVSKILLPGNISAQFTGIVITYPDGQPTQQIGVEIDLSFNRSGVGISSGQDEELEYVINHIIKKGKI